VTKLLTVVASLVLFPTFVVGVYGQNFRRIPRAPLGLRICVLLGVIIVTTLVQLWFYRRKKWI
jgi:Mg2+ and Co2+ transporters